MILLVTCITVLAHSIILLGWQREMKAHRLQHELVIAKIELLEKRMGLLSARNFFLWKSINLPEPKDEMLLNILEGKE